MSRWLRVWVAGCTAVALGAAIALAGSQADSVGMDWSQIPEYRIVPGDLLVLDFGPREDGDGNLLRPMRVRPDGRISVYPVGDVIAAGRTARELEAALVELLAAELKNPRVTVEVSEPAGNQIHVLGRVEQPGSFPVGPFATVLEAVTKAGGFKDDAAKNSVIVFHRDGARTVSVARLRLGDAIAEGKLEADMRLSRFDIVYVPRSTIGNLGQFTKQFFGDHLAALNAVLVGWELFHLDRVFLLGPR